MRAGPPSVRLSERFQVVAAAPPAVSPENGSNTVEAKFLIYDEQGQGGLNVCVGVSKGLPRNDPSPRTHTHLCDICVKAEQEASEMVCFLAVVQRGGGSLR